MAARQAGSADPEAGGEARSGLQYDIYKGPEHIRPCDHQAVQSVFVVESKDKGANPYDVFDIVHADEANEANLKVCAEEGHA